MGEYGDYGGYDDERAVPPINADFLCRHVDCY